MQRDSKPVFIFFHLLEFPATQETKVWGQVETQEPQLGSDGKYVLPNPQENVPESRVEEARTKISEQFPETTELQSRKTIAREFPEGRWRYIVVLRFKTSEVRYVVLKGDQKTWVQEYDTIEQDLEVITEQIKNEIELKKKL